MVETAVVLFENLQRSQSRKNGDRRNFEFNPKRGNNVNTAFVLGQLPRSKDRRSNEDHALAAFVHPTSVAYSSFVRLHSCHCADPSTLFMILAEKAIEKMAWLASRGSESLQLRESTMQSRNPSRPSVYVLALAVILLSQQIVSQTQSSSQPSTNPTTTSNAKPSPGKVNCTSNGTYVNSKGQTVQRPENCSGPPQGATAQCRDGSYSFSTSRRGTCSHHGGVAKWL